MGGGIGPATASSAVATSGASSQHGTASSLAALMASPVRTVAGQLRLPPPPEGMYREEAHRLGDILAPQSPSSDAVSAARGAMSLSAGRKAWLYTLIARGGQADSTSGWMELVLALLLVQYTGPDQPSLAQLVTSANLEDAIKLLDISDWSAVRSFARSYAPSIVEDNVATALLAIELILSALARRGIFSRASLGIVEAGDDDGSVVALEEQRSSYDTFLAASAPRPSPSRASATVVPAGGNRQRSSQVLFPTGGAGAQMSGGGVGATAPPLNAVRFQSKWSQGKKTSPGLVPTIHTIDETGGGHLTYPPVETVASGWWVPPSGQFVFDALSDIFGIRFGRLDQGMPLQPFVDPASHKGGGRPLPDHHMIPACLSSRSAREEMLMDLLAGSATHNPSEFPPVRAALDRVRRRFQAMAEDGHSDVFIATWFALSAARAIQTRDINMLANDMLEFPMERDARAILLRAGLEEFATSRSSYGRPSFSGSSGGGAFAGGGGGASAGGRVGDNPEFDPSKWCSWHQHHGHDREGCFVFSKNTAKCVWKRKFGDIFQFMASLPSDDAREGVLRTVPRGDRDEVRRRLHKHMNSMGAGAEDDDAPTAKKSKKKHD